MQKSIANKFSPRILNVLPNSKIIQPKGNQKDTKLIELLSKSTASNCQLLSEFFVKDSFLLVRNKDSFQEWVASHISGQKAAQFVIDNHPECFTYDPSNGLFKCYASSKTFNYNKDSPEIKDLQYMIERHDLKKSSELYDKIMEIDPKKLDGHDLISKLMDLICTDLILKYYGASLKNPNEILLSSLTNSSQEEIFEAAKNRVLNVYNAHKTGACLLSLTDTVVRSFFETKLFNTVIQIIDGYDSEFIKSLSSKAKSCYISSKIALISGEDNPDFLLELHKQFIEHAIALNVNFSTSIYNSFLHGMSQIRSNKPRAPLLKLSGIIMQEMEHNGIKPDLETISLLHSCLSASELFSGSVAELFIKYLEKISCEKSADYSICMKYPDMFNKMIKTFKNKGYANETIRLYNVFRKFKGYSYGMTPQSHQSFLNNYCQILIDTLPLNHSIKKLKEVVPSSYLLTIPLVRSLLDKIITTGEFEHLMWIYQVDMRLYSGYSFQKELFLHACSRAFLNDNFKPDQDFLMVMEKVACKEIEFLRSTYKTHAGLFQFDLAGNSNYLKHAIIIGCKLNCSGEIMLLKERFVEKCAGSHINYEPDELEAVKEFVGQNDEFSWLLEFIPKLKS